MTTPYTVQRGDNLSKIARAHGLSNWREIYDHPDNDSFRRRRPDPNLIYPGDIVMIPGPTSNNQAVPGGDESSADEEQDDGQSELHFEGQEFGEPLPPTQPTIPSSNETVASVFPAPPVQQSGDGGQVAQRRNIIFISREHV